VRPAAVFFLFHAVEPELERRIVWILRRIVRFQRWVFGRFLEQLARWFAVVGRCQWRRFDAGRIFRRPIWRRER
jgi:hypothetical protein